jgi:hypothetical protein
MGGKIATIGLIDENYLENRVRNTCEILLYRHTLRQIPRLVYVAAAENGDVIC